MFIWLLDSSLIQSKPANKLELVTLGGFCLVGIIWQSLVLFRK
jgi:hypothetical protein